MKQQDALFRLGSVIVCSWQEKVRKSILGKNTSARMATSGKPERFLKISHIKWYQLHSKVFARSFTLICCSGPASVYSPSESPDTAMAMTHKWSQQTHKLDVSLKTAMTCQVHHSSLKPQGKSPNHQLACLHSVPITNHNNPLKNDSSVLISGNDLHYFATKQNSNSRGKCQIRCRSRLDRGTSS